MKRDMLALKQKLMQRFLDGAITQETYDRMLQDIEQMEVEDAQLADRALRAGWGVLVRRGACFAGTAAGVSCQPDGWRAAFHGWGHSADGSAAAGDERPRQRGLHDHD